MCNSFEKGFLYVRQWDGQEIIFFPAQEVPAGLRRFPCCGIAEFHGDGAGVPTWSYIEGAQHGESVGGFVVEFRKATDADIKRLVDSFTLNKLVERVINHPGPLAPEEKARIARIAGDPAVRAGL